MLKLPSAQDGFHLMALELISTDAGLVLLGELAYLCVWLYPWSVW